MYRYKHHVIDTSLPTGMYAQTMLEDFDNDGRLEYVLGLSLGDLYLYKQHPDGNWQRFLIGRDSPSDVGAAALDVNGNGLLDIVTGGAWFENTGDFTVPFIKHVFDPELASAHDVFVADISGDGKADVVTMSDQNDVRWYRIADKPTDHWIHTHIGEPVHAGVAIGDINGNGSMDIVRTNVWFENLRGDGSVWAVHALPFPPQDQSKLTKYFMVDATHAKVVDVNQSVFNDIVMVENEMPGGKLFWLENVKGDGSEWRYHDIAVPGSPVRGAYHSLVVKDLNGNGAFDVFSCEMEDIGGEEPPRFYIWENVDGKGGEWKEHVILDVNLGGHAALIGDISGNGLPDIITKPWRPGPNNAVGGKPFVMYLENLGPLTD